jgi:hypothetical protein
MADDERVLTTLSKGDTHEIRVTIKAFRGAQYLDIRQHWRDDGGEWHPTKKGVSLNVEYVPDLLEALQRAEELI